MPCPGLVGALCVAVPANDFVHPTVGRVHRLEAGQALFELSLNERRLLFVQKVDERLRGGTRMAASFSRLQDWTGQSMGQNMAFAPPPPPVPSGKPVARGTPPLFYRPFFGSIAFVAKATIAV